jgi:WD40 repeat protein
VDDDLRSQAAATLAGLDTKTLRLFTHTAAHFLAFDAQGERLLMDGGGEGPATLWDVRNDHLSDLNATNSGPVWFASNGSLRQFAHKGQGTFAVVDLNDGHLFQEFHLGGDGVAMGVAVQALAVSADGSRCAAAATNGPWGQLAVWETATGKLVAQTQEICAALAFSPDNDCLAIGDTGGHVRVLSLPNLNKVAAFQQDRVAVKCLAFQRDVSQQTEAATKYPWLLAAGDEGGTVCIYEVATGRLRTPCRGSSFNLDAIAFSPDGMTLASGDHYGVRFWDIVTGHLKTMTRRGYITALAFSPDGTKLAVGNETRYGPAQSMVIEFVKWRGLRALHGLSSPSGKPVFSPDGRRLAALAQNWRVGVWDLASNHFERLLEAPKGIFTDNAAMAFSRDGRQLAFATSQEACLWECESGQLRKSWKLPRGLQQGLCFDSLGRLLHFQWEKQANERSGMCRVRDLSRDDYTNAMASFAPFDGWIFDSALSNDGRLIAVCGASLDQAHTNHILQVFEPTTGSLLCSLPMTRPFNWNGDALALDPSGSLLAHWDTKAARTLVYAMPSGTETQRHLTMVDALSPGGHWLAGQDRQNGQGFTVRKADDTNWSLCLGVDHLIAMHPQFSLDGRLVAWGTAEGTVFVCDLEDTIHRLEQLGLGW